MNRTRHRLRYALAAIVAWSFYTGLFFDIGRLMRWGLRRLDPVPGPFAGHGAPGNANDLLFTATSVPWCAITAALVVILMVYLCRPLDNPPIDYGPEQESRRG